MRPTEWRSVTDRQPISDDPVMVQFEDSDLSEFVEIADENGEISKRDLIVLTKESKFWKKYMEVKARPGAQISKVRVCW